MDPNRYMCEWAKQKRNSKRPSMHFRIFTLNFSILIRDNDLDLSILLDLSFSNIQHLFRTPFRLPKFRLWNWHLTVLHLRHAVFYANIFENVVQRIEFAVQLVVGVSPLCRLYFRHSSFKLPRTTIKDYKSLHTSSAVPISNSNCFRLESNTHSARLCATDLNH